MAAGADLKNAREREKRRAAHHVALADVELRSAARNRWWTSTVDPVADDDAESIARLREQFHGQERDVVELIVDGERRTERFARVLGLQDRPREEQAREVKRAKDRVKKRLQRLWQRMADDD